MKKDAITVVLYKECSTNTPPISSFSFFCSFFSFFSGFRIIHSNSPSPKDLLKPRTAQSSQPERNGARTSSRRIILSEIGAFRTLPRKQFTSFSSPVPYLPPGNQQMHGFSCPLYHLERMAVGSNSFLEHVEKPQAIFFVFLKLRKTNEGKSSSLAIVDYRVARVWVFSCSNIDIRGD